MHYSNLWEADKYRVAVVLIILVRVADITFF